jgi:hypothetical protein
MRNSSVFTLQVDSFMSSILGSLRNLPDVAEVQVCVACLCVYVCMCVFYVRVCMHAHGNLPDVAEVQVCVACLLVCVYVCV